MKCIICGNETGSIQDTCCGACWREALVREVATRVHDQFMDTVVKLGRGLREECTGQKDGYNFMR